MDGRQIRALRMHHGLTQAEVAEAAGMHQSDVSAVESGRKTGVELRKRVVGGIVRGTRPSRVVEMHGARMRAYLEEQGVTHAQVFGSVARGTDRWDSDIDIVAEFPPTTSLVTVMAWEAELRRLTGGIPVDLVSAGEEFTRLGDAARETVPL